MVKYNLHQQYFLTEEFVNGECATYTLLQFCQKIIKAVQTNQINDIFQKYPFFLHGCRCPFPFILFNVSLSLLSRGNYLFSVND